MIPIAIDPRSVRVAVAGDGVLAARRLAALRRAGAAGAAAFAAAPDDAALAEIDVLWIVDLPEAAALAARARRAKVLVNVEDVPGLCDFHSVAEVRRGDLLLTVSTSGAAPGLAGAIRRRLEGCFPAVWGERVAEVAALRRGWRTAGVAMPEAALRIDALVDERCWVNCPALR